MIRYDGTFYQQMLYHDGSYGSSLLVKPAIYMGGGKLHKLIVKCRTANSTTQGTFRIVLNGTNITGAIPFKSMTAGEVWEYVFIPSSFTSGISPEIRGTDRLEIAFPTAPSGTLYVGLVMV